MTGLQKQSELQLVGQTRSQPWFRPQLGFLDCLCLDRRDPLNAFAHVALGVGSLWKTLVLVRSSVVMDSFQGSRWNGIGFWMTYLYIVLEARLAGVKLIRNCTGDCHWGRFLKVPHGSSRFILNNFLFFYFFHFLSWSLPLALFSLSSGLQAFSPSSWARIALCILLRHMCLRTATMSVQTCARMPLPKDLHSEAIVQLPCPQQNIE